MKEFILGLIATILSWFNLSPVPPIPISIDYRIVEVARNLAVPWSLAFTSNHRILVTERGGALREVVDGQVNPKILLTFPEVYAESEAGLMGLTVDPNYVSNKYLYVCLTYKSGQTIANKVVRLIDKEGNVTVDKVLVDGIPGARVHIGCRLKFGPDNKLYITTGDATNKSLAQDKDSKAGKILRVNSDGSDLEINSLGHRNPQGIAWNSKGEMWETEHGPSGFDGPCGGDEINVITKDGNYGWPTVSHDKSKAGLISPKLIFTPAIAPAGAAFLNDVFYFAALKGAALYKVTSDFKYEKLPGIEFGRIREVVAGPDGALYFTTSNKDGRGSPRDGDDKIYKIIGL